MADAAETDRIFWRVVGHAATRPLNLAVLGVLVLASFLVGLWVAIAIVPVYGLLVAATVNDPETAQRLAAGRERKALTSAGRPLDGVTGELRRRVATALGEERRIQAELAALPAAGDDLATQVRCLVDDLVVVARRASVVDLYLGSIDLQDVRRRRDAASGPAQLALTEQLEVCDVLIARRAELDAEISHVEAALPAMRARLVQSRLAAVAPSDMTGDITALRERMGILAASLAEAYGSGDETTPNGA